MALSDRIEAFITELLKNEEDEWLEIGRNELAQIFGCVPSQINYVITTRFSNTNGYMVESRRGGGGYLRIRRIPTDENTIYLNTLKSIPESIDMNSSVILLEYLRKTGAITDAEFNIMASAVSDNTLTVTQPTRNILRSNILKKMIAAKTK